MRRLFTRYTVRRCLAIVAAVALTLGTWREWRRVTAFRAAATIYAIDEQRYREESKKLLGAGRLEEAAARARDADDAGKESRWYSEHLFWGGSRSLNPRFELRRGWRLDVAYDRAPEVMIGKVVRIESDGTAATFTVSEALKGKPSPSESMTISTRFIPNQGACLAVGREYLVFYVRDVRQGNPAMRLAENTAENLKALGMGTTRQ